MLHLKKVLLAKPKPHEKVELQMLTTPWGEGESGNDAENGVGAEDGILSFDDGGFSDHPTPQFARAQWMSLNGTWDCAFVPDAYQLQDNLELVVRMAEPPATWPERIRVPFSPEAPLSGVGHQLQPCELLWYRRTIDLAGEGFPLRSENADGKPDSSNRILLHFQAVDAVCAVWCNGQLLGTHEGGYTPFSFDVTDCLAIADDATSALELLVCVADPSEFGGQLRGKQRIDRGDIWYSAQSGIWQDVWLEAVPRDHMIQAMLQPDADTGILAVGVRLDTQASHKLHLEALDADGRCLADASCETADTTAALALHIPEPHLWSPDSPYLYRLRLTYGDDAVESYCAFRTVEMRRDEAGALRVYLNGWPIFLKGVLDQAYWPDGLMTAPADAALVHDILAMRELGFNMMRKHIKIECERWYYHCDRLGMLVWQDMVTGGAAQMDTWQSSYKPTLFRISWNHYRDTIRSHQEKLGAADEAYRREWMRTCRLTIELLGNHPCIITWVLFNEGWGQFDARAAYAMASKLDPTRPIDATSGWYDQGCGDFHSVHNYFRDMAVCRDGARWRDGRGRAFVVSEFGGYSLHVAGHTSLDEVYGYEVYEDPHAWQQKVREALAEMDALESRGLAGYVYTQVSDIEEEMNGLLTYDRRVNKMQE